MVSIVRLTPLRRKMLRELWKLRGQLLSIGLVVAAAVMTLVTMRGTYDALVDARASYYSDYRLGDLWASLERAPEPIRRQIEGLDGVAAVQTRVTSAATLILPWLDVPGQGLFVSVPDEGRANVDDIHVRDGRYLLPDGRNEVLVSESFYEANELASGDTLRAVINGVARSLIVVGSAISPAHSYSVPPGALYPDDERFGVFWVSRRLLGPSLAMEDAFNEVAVALTPGANTDALVREVDRILDPYGGLGSYTRPDQLSWKILNDELESNRTTGTVFPLVFLGVAAFLLNLVLGRLVGTQRTEIGALKAMGYHDREVGRHFLGYSFVSVGLGTLLGALGGVGSGGAMVVLCREYVKFPVLEYELAVHLVLVGGAFSLVAAFVGGAGSVRRATSLPPAEAMRPIAPDTFAPGRFERWGWTAWLSIGGRLVLRNLERRPVRAALSSLGVAFSVAILVVGMFMFDGVDRMMDRQFEHVQREDLGVAFNRDVAGGVRHDLAAIPGVLRVEPYVTVPVRLRHRHRERELAITGLELDSRLRRIIDASGREHALPARGLIVSRLLADRLGALPGDTLLVEALTGRQHTVPMVVAGTVDDVLGISAYASLESLRPLTREGPRASGAYLLTEHRHVPAIAAELQQAPLVAGVVSPDDMLESFQKQMDESFLVAVSFTLGFAMVISVAVIYNGTRIALSERGRELASLRVLGLTKREVSTLLFGEQAVITLLAIPLGWAIGYALSHVVVNALASETYRIPLIVAGRTYAWTAAITVASALASAALVRRRLHGMDLIAVLKTRE